MQKLTNLLIAFIILLITLTVLGGAVIWYIEQGIGRGNTSFVVLGLLGAFFILVGWYMANQSQRNTLDGFKDTFTSLIESAAQISKAHGRADAYDARAAADQQRAMGKMYAHGLLKGQRMQLPAPQEDAGDDDFFWDEDDAIEVEPAQKNFRGEL